METLKNKLLELVEQLSHQDKSKLKDSLTRLVSVFPFNEYEYIIVFLKDRDVFTFEEYERMRGSYIDGHKHLHLYGLSPRVFGEIWGQDHLRGIDDRIQKPSRKLDPSLDGEYDLWVESVKVEVKACRAMNKKKRCDLVSKALKFSSTEPFWMNFQQLKPDNCDVFVFIGVWVDQICYWVLSPDEVNASPYISHQHRGGIEYQIGITNNNLQQFDAFKVPAVDIVKTILLKGNKKNI